MWSQVKGMRKGSVEDDGIMQRVKGREMPRNTWKHSREGGMQEQREVQTRQQRTGYRWLRTLSRAMSGATLVCICCVS